MPTDVDIPESPVAGDPPPEHAAAGLRWWVTEELLQRLYAVRQDLAEAGESARDGGRRAEELRDTVLAMIRRLRGVAEMLGQEPAGETSLRTEHLAGLVRTECREARRLLGVDLPDVPRGSARRRG